MQSCDVAMRLPPDGAILQRAAAVANLPDNSFCNIAAAPDSEQQPL
jgi:hypothetical protein